MTREIKFRAWDKANRIMMHHDNNDITFWRYDKQGYKVIGFSIYAEEIIPMQYTGLKDKNGKEIYEGDIVIDKFYFKDGKIVETTRKVEWDEVNPCFVLTNVHKNHDWEYDFVACGLRSLEIIGNIYENPELLEGNTHERTPSHSRVNLSRIKRSSPYHRGVISKT